MLTKKFCLLQVFCVVLLFNHVKGLCPYAHQFNDVMANSIDDAGNDIDISDTISESYMSSISYDTYQTSCHWFVSQPPSISSEIIEHAFKRAAVQTEKYTIIDIEATGEDQKKLGEDHKKLGKDHKKLGEDHKKLKDKSTSLAEMDRINFLFESATRYIQETTCTSKATTTLYLSKFQLDNFFHVAKAICDGGHIKYPDCSSKSLQRQVDGTCNNLERPLDGGVGDCMLRLLPPDFKDGISQLRTSSDGTPLPNPKLLSTNIFGGAEYR